LGCTADSVKEEKPIESSTQTTLMTREDSIMRLAEELNIPIDKANDDVHSILTKIITQKTKLLSRLDSLNERANDMERMAYEYKKKEDDEIKAKLLAEINDIKAELEKIKRFAKENEVKNKESLKIPEKPIVDTKTFEDLEPGNYVLRLDRTHILRVFVTPEKQVIVSNPILDSTTVFRNTGTPLSPRMQKELQQIKDRVKNQNN
jgi:seryl-tRNA synthetase